MRKTLKMSAKNYDPINNVYQKNKTLSMKTQGRKVGIAIHIHGSATLSISEFFFLIKNEAQRLELHILCKIT